ncbi:MAG: hypothetical protein FJZ67_08815 [Bacteroidetes bacterium]|nr:hypothetical protein [Bacteroidota bacterium]
MRSQLCLPLFLTALVFYLNISKINAQIDTIKSIHLDSMIWKKISDYRQSIGVRPLKKFETKKLREYSLMIAQRNLPKGVHAVHSNQAGERYNAECLFVSIRTGNNGKIYDEIYSDLMKGKYDRFATQCVEAWIASPSHQEAISDHDNVIVSIGTIITAEKMKDGTYKIHFVSYYHGLSDNPDHCQKCYANIK